MAKERWHLGGPRAKPLFIAALVFFVPAVLAIPNMRSADGLMSALLGIVLGTILGCVAVARSEAPDHDARVIKRWVRTFR